MGFLKSLFSGKTEDPETEKQKNDQKSFEIFKYDGMRAQRMGRPDYAIKCFKEALSLQEDFETMSYLAQIYVQTSDLDQARSLLEQMITLEPEHIDSYLSLANVCFLQEDYQTMEKVTNKAIEIEEGNATAHYLLGKAYQGLDDWLMSIAELTRAILLKDDFSEARLLRAETLIKLEQYEEATEDIEAILSQKPEEESALILRGKVKEATGKAEEAEKDYRYITELNPFNEQAFLALGQLYINAKKMTEAIEIFDEAIDLNPNFAQAYHERGKAKLLNGDKEGSIEDMKKGLELSPKEAQSISGEYGNLQGNNASSNILGL